MKRIPREQYTHNFDKDVPPVLTIAPGETIEMDSYDTTIGRIHKPEDVFTHIKVRDPEKVNPATGPVYVEGAAPGDTLVVEILDIQLDPTGSLRITPTALGMLTDEMEKPYCRIVTIEDGVAHFAEGISFPVRPMVGVIGTAPAEGRVNTAVPAEIGSNLDHQDVKVGTKVYLPVHVPGALFALGDLHASMGDGEVTGNGIEIGGCTTVRVELIKNRRWARPWFETAESWITTASEPTILEGIRVAVRDMVDLLAERLRLRREDAYVLISARGDVRLGQACGGMPSTVRVVFPKLSRE
ncbi:MAG: acetamidase/formamidase family protein [Chloroflexota bacterium]